MNRDNLINKFEAIVLDLFQQETEKLSDEDLKTICQQKVFLNLKIKGAFRDFLSRAINSNDVEYVYPSLYKPKSVEEQAEILKGYFPNLQTIDLSFSKNRLPVGAEAWFVVPRPESLADFYLDAVSLVFEALNKHTVENGFEFQNCFGDFTSCKRSIIREANSLKSFNKIVEEQGHRDMIILPAQFGQKYSGKSIVHVLRSMDGLEFGLNSLQVGSMLLTHPERLGYLDDLFIDCPGDKISIDGETFNSSLSFRTISGRIEYKSVQIVEASEDSGSATGFCF